MVEMENCNKLFEDLLLENGYTKHAIDDSNTSCKTRLERPLDASEENYFAVFKLPSSPQGFELSG